MEDPITFDVYARAFDPSQQFAALVLASQGYESDLKARVAATTARVSDGYALAAHRVGWKRAQQVAAEVAHRTDVKLMQAGYTPSEQSQYCKRHQLHFGGSRRCHVRNDFYAA